MKRIKELIKFWKDWRKDIKERGKERAWVAFSHKVRFWFYLNYVKNGVIYVAGNTGKSISDGYEEVHRGGYVVMQQD